MSLPLTNACNALDALATAVRDGWSGDQTLLEAWGWNCPALNRNDLSGMAKQLSDRLKEVSPDSLTPDIDALLGLVPQRLALFQGNTLPHLYNGNATGAYPAYIALLDWTRQICSPVLLPEVDWRDIEEQKLMPRALVRRLRSIDTQINNLEEKAGSLDTKVSAINDAHAAAEQLPTDLASVQEAEKQISNLKVSSNENKIQIETLLKESSEKISELRDAAEEARNLVENCEDAYSAATTKGLGEAFSKRADSLSKSMWVWVAGLLVALSIGAWLGAKRVELLKTLMAVQDPHLGMIWLNIALAIFSIAAPLWFAWVATKQIGQRFRLAEDYAFKASVAKAYEGYRREAARLDPQFAARLFSLALSRIEEAPLRFVETETHGSPWHEALSARLKAGVVKRDTKAIEPEETQ